MRCQAGSKCGRPRPIWSDLAGDSADQQRGGRGQSKRMATAACFGFTTRLVLAMVRLTRCDRRAKIRNIDCQEGALGREDTTHGLPTHARLAGGCQK